MLTERRERERERETGEFQVANTWPKKTGRDVYAMVRNGKKPENPQNLSVAATLEKANTYVFAESPIRNAEARGSIPLCSTNNTHRFNDLPAPTLVLV